MKNKSFPIIFTLIILIGAAVSISMIASLKLKMQDTTLLNDCRKEIEANYGDTARYPDTPEYAIIDINGSLIYKNGPGVSDSVNEAAQYGDAVFDLIVEDAVIGKIIFKNTFRDEIKSIRKSLIIIIVGFSALELLVMVLYYLYLKKKIITPFKKLGDFAVRVAGGNLDVPLYMDREHIFGGFTEAFDLMRSELKKARIAEKKANDDKKETIAKLSHDIKTPVASIKATSELGYELVGEERVKEFFHLINVKADQVTTLTDNLFHSSVQELTEITVSPTLQPSLPIAEIIKNADYLNKAGAFKVPERMVFMDKLRLQQVFDNIFLNSYKYADTPIDIGIDEDDECLIVSITDHGPGVKPEELCVIREKYRRGSNTAEKEGAGLGLYLADHFMEQMDGKLELISDNGFTVKVFIRKG